MSLQIPESMSRFERAEMESAFQTCVRAPDLRRAEIVATHYISLFRTAQDILEVVKHMRAVGPERRAEHDELLKTLIADITRAHRTDFGIALDWPNR